MDILIGKEGNQPFLLTEASISRKHALFHMDERTGIMTLRDVGSVNGTYVKANDGTFKRINGEVKVGFSNIIRLGAVHTFKIKDLLSHSGGDDTGKDSVDISKLRNVYEIYNTNRMDLEAQTSSIMMLRLAAMTVSTVLVNVIVLTIPDNSMDKMTRGIIQAVGSIIAIGLAWVIVGMKNKNLIERKDQNERYFKKNYCCPKCGYHFGNHIYSNILAEGHCPNKSCKCKFTEK
ncbi:FHA domain-containing protein [Sodaliphilus sp.]|uniref:FHA domain-containing protein n=1 Tax=Sodaliphilus sp. TaxID=2815818 RepID=UPI00388E67CC